MFKNLLVPLDGSNLSEASLPAAAELSKKYGARVTLLHVIEQDAPAHIHADRHLTAPDEAERYLQDVAERAFPRGVEVRTHVHTAPVSDVARSIVEHATKEFKPDLIVASTHGRGGVRDVLYGSIAQQIVAHGATPLLLIRPDTSKFHIQKALLPLDPDSVHDDSLPVGESLAKTFGAELMLLSVVPTYSTLAGEQVATSSLLPSATQAVLDLQEQTARAHLQQHVELLRQKGVAASGTVSRGEPASTIVKAAEQSGVDLIILTTHGKAGIGAFWSRSVAPKVAQLTKIPLLLMPAPEGPTRGRVANMGTTTST